MIDSYHGYVKRLQKSVGAEFERLEAIYNFDYGDEFEIAICELLSKVLPLGLSVCRGYVVTIDNDVAGDDIIIYDASRFPSLRLSERDCFQRKQHIPVEAVYGYVEAKHTLYLERQGGQSIGKAFEQVARVKRLKRVDRPLNELVRGVTFRNQHIEPQIRQDKWNRLWGGVIARRTKLSTSSTEYITTHAAANDALTNAAPSELSAGEGPDMLVLCEDVVYLPVIMTSENAADVYPFHRGGMLLQGKTVPSYGFAIGLIAMMSAFDRVKLGSFPYAEVLNKAHRNS